MSTIYFRGNIITMNEDEPIVSAIYVHHGKITKIGNDKEILKLKTKDTECIDLQGKTMMPGFIDGHSHFAGLANSLSQCDLSQTHSYQDIVLKMKEFIKINHITKGEWVIGTNYDHNFLEEKQHPHRYILDEISKEYPIVIIHASSHMGVANSLALLEQGLNKQVQDPQGGHYGRFDNQELNGYMEENAFINFRNHMPMLSIEKYMELFKKAQDIYASYGITTIQEGMITRPLWQLLKYASDTGVLKLDITGYIDLENEENLLLENMDYVNQYRNHLKIGGYKVFLDGSPQGKTAWLKEPYEGDKQDYCGYPIMSDQHLYELILKSLQKNQQLLAHCNGDQAAEQYITQFEKVHHDYPHFNTHRPVMIHAQCVQKEQLQRMVDLKMSPSFFIAHTYYWGDVHIQNLGYHRASLISPAHSAIQLGLPVTFHQDSPVLMPNVFQTIWCATHRKTKNNIELNQEECISVYDALKAVTVHGAYQYCEENQKGTIEVGKKADFIILNKNPIICPIDEIKDIQVLATIKDNQVFYRK